MTLKYSAFTFKIWYL